MSRQPRPARSARISNCGVRTCTAVSVFVFRSGRTRGGPNFGFWKRGSTRKIKAKIAAVKTTSAKVFLGFMAKNRSMPPAEPDQSAKSQDRTRQRHQEKQTDIRQLPRGHHELVLRDGMRADPLKQLRLIQQPVGGKSDEVTIRSELHQVIFQKHRVPDNQYGGRAALMQNSFYRSFFHR